VLFDSTGIQCQGQIDYSEIGMTAAKAKECGVTDAYNRVKDEVPNVDDQIANCNAQSGDDRTACWVQFDKDLMTDVVPWVPYLWATAFTVAGPNVTKYEFDQFSGSVSFCHLSVDNGIDDPLSVAA
jgi:hypothetical protein